MEVGPPIEASRRGTDRKGANHSEFQSTTFSSRFRQESSYRYYSCLGCRQLVVIASNPTNPLTVGLLAHGSRSSNGMAGASFALGRDTSGAIVDRPESVPSATANIIPAFVRRILQGRCIYCQPSLAQPRNVPSPQLNPEGPPMLPHPPHQSSVLTRKRCCCRRLAPAFAILPNRIAQLTCGFY